MKFGHHKYTFTMRPWDKPGKGLGQHRWQVVGPEGGVEFTATFFKEHEEPSCGLEFHHGPSAQETFFPGQAPHHLRCHLLEGPCWHEGTSLYASETLWPMVTVWLSNGDHEQVFSLLEHEYGQRFETVMGG